MIDIKEIHDLSMLIKQAKWLEGKTLAEISEEIWKSDRMSRVVTKGHVGYVIERGYFGISKNSNSKPDIEHLWVEIKTCPLKYNAARDHLSVKEPLSLNIINYFDETKCDDIKESALYKKNRKTLFVLYIHDREKERSEYLIKYVFLWDMDKSVLDELRPDYKKIVDKIRRGLAHEIHQSDHEYLTLCPKHSGTFKDRACTKSKRKQPFSERPAEIRAFRLKNRYMNLVISRHLGKILEKGGWDAE